MKVEPIIPAQRQRKFPNYLSPDYYPTLEEMQDFNDMLDKIDLSEKPPKREKQFGRVDIFA